LKEKDMENMRLHAQYQKEFDSKMRIQEELEKQKHMPVQGATQVPNISSRKQGQKSESVMVSDMSFELNTCSDCSTAFSSIAELQNHQKGCGGRGRKPSRFS
jgi:hypothetical protein